MDLMLMIEEHDLTAGRNRGGMVASSAEPYGADILSVLARRFILESTERIPVVVDGFFP